VTAEGALDGIYVLRTNLPKRQMSAAETVRSYKGLCEVERAFRSLKSVDLKIRPIHHRLEDRVRAHIFLCTLAYYVEWHVSEAWRELLFSDEDLEAKRTRDPVAAAKRSSEALQKITERTLTDGTPVHSFRTLMQELATIVSNTCVTRSAKSGSPGFQMPPTPTATQHRAIQLLQQITVRVH
jgi:Transposase DDE domain